MGFIYNQLMVTPAYPRTTMEGQTIIITGSNAGLGKEAARHCVRLKASKVILAVRNTQAGEEAKTEIEKSEKRPGTCEVWKLDLASYESVKAFASRAANELDRVDVLLENAGIATHTYRRAEDDESTITVNVLSTFLLALLMLPTLQKSAEKHGSQAKLVIVSSEVHAWSKFAERDADNILATLSDEKTAHMKERYPTSKLLEVLIIRHIAPLIASSANKSVTLTMLNPGLCHSELARESDSWVFWAMKKVLARTTEVGSRTLVAAALVGPEAHGKYMSNGVVYDQEVVAWVKTPEGEKVAAKLWKEVGQKLEQTSPGLLKNLQ